MMDEAEEELLRKSTSALQLITAAMLAGIVLFMGVAAFISLSERRAGPPATPLLSYLAAGYLALSLPLSIVVSLAMTRTTLKGMARGQEAAGAAVASTTQELLGARQTT